MPAHIVIDLGFGDGGKGLAVDKICSDCEATRTIVIRFSGGQQCGHTVMPSPDVKHVFSSFGSGTFAGAPTFFTEDTTFYLPALINEWCRMPLKFANEPKLFIHPLAMLTTPYDIAYNRTKETLITKHGSCGLGVGATMKRNLETPFKIFAQDLLYSPALRQKLCNVKAYYESLLVTREAFDLFHEILSECALEETFWNDISTRLVWPFKITDVDVSQYETHVFEGSQGIMLDMDHGIFPNVTFANTTVKNAVKFCNARGIRLTDIHYVTRCYTTRHGEGWMPNETPVALINTEEEINTTNAWQGGFRIGEIDYDMLNYALDIDALYHPNAYYVQKHLKISCLDQRPDFILDKNKLNIQQFSSVLGNYSPVRGNYKPL